MLPELLRFSSSAHLLEHIPEEQQRHHRVSAGTGANATVVSYAAQRAQEAGANGGLWAGWGDGAAAPGLSGALAEADTDGLDLDGLGL